MTNKKIKQLAEQLNFEPYDYFGTTEAGEMKPPKHLVLKADTIINGQVTVSKIDTNGFRLFVIGTIDFDTTEISGNQLIGK